MGEPVGFTHLRALIVALLATLTVSAHEIGTTQVRVAFLKDHTYRIDVVSGAQPLLRKLQAKTHTRAASLTHYTPQLSNAAEIRFGATRVQPKINVLTDGDVATIRLTGDVPRNAGAFTWRYGLTYASYAMTIETPHAPPQRVWLDGDAQSAPFPLDERLLPPSRLGVLRQYLVLGYTHIVPYGLDHILFVLGMFLLSSRLRPVLTQVTAFTLAHSITLGLSIYGVVSASPRIVEPLIALSIAYVAVENLTTTQLKPWRVAIVFAFGLLHGLGFAGVLRELGIPRGEFATALVAFNVGVELGQLSVIAAAWLLIVSWAQAKPWYRRRLLVPASCAIAAMGVVWMIERI
ncbi:MAG: HupE/UreJ family protein [Acidobacteriota bacterium]|nr:HupE/UreJ family protein [Acidobacteriota bacterium]